MCGSPVFEGFLEGATLAFKLSYTPTRHTRRFVHDAHRDGGRHRPQRRAHARVARDGARSGHTKRGSPLSTRSGPPARRVLVRATSGSRVTRERAVPSVSPPVTETGRSRAGGKGVRWEGGAHPP